MLGLGTQKMAIESNWFWWWWICFSGGGGDTWQMQMLDICHCL